MNHKLTHASLVFAALTACASAAPSTKASTTAMTDTRTFGRILGETARAARELHLHVLAEQGTNFESWVAFTLLGENAPEMPLQELVPDLARRLEIDPSAGRQLLDRMASAGHVRTRVDGDTELIAMTDAGVAYFGRVRAAVGRATEQLLGDLDPGEVATAAEVLRAVGDTATSMLR